MHEGERQAGLDEFDLAMTARGWTLFKSVVPPDLCDRLRKDIATHVERCGRLQVKAGIPGAPDGTAHHTVGHGDSLDDFLAAGFLEDYVRAYFGGPFILHAFNPVTIPRSGSNYVHRIHKDCRTHTGSFRMMLNMLVLVDPFTLENGATHILSGSHHHAGAPSEEYFFRHAERITGPVGSVVLFNSGVWHAAGQNRSERVRTALTLSFSRPFVKPQMDYARFLGPDRESSMPERLRQLFGYHARVATSLEEWYRPVGSRMYRADQG